MSSAQVRTSPCLAKAEPGRKVARSKATRWRAWVLIGIHVLFAIHIGHLISTGSTISPFEPSEAMEFSKHSIVNTGLVLFVSLIASTLVFGRFFCGWGCHVVALQDLCRAFLLKIGVTPRPLRSRLIALVPLIAFVYMFLWPVAYRIWIGDDFAIRGVALTTSDFWKTFSGPGVAALTFIVCGFMTIYFLGAKGFCTYGCPYGAIFGVADKLAPGRIRVTDACEGCGHCTIVCTSNVQVSQEVRDYGMVVDPGCMKCLDCVSVCPKDALYFGFGKPSLLAKPRREPKKRKPALSLSEEVLVGVTFLFAFVAFRGLYYLVPFLLSLGIAAIVSSCVLLLWQLRTKDNVQFPGIPLKQAGSVQTAGKVFVAAFLVFVVFWAHSGIVTYQVWRNARDFSALAEVRGHWFDPNREPLSAADEALAQQVKSRAQFLGGFALLQKPDTLAELTWAHLLTGDEEEFVESAAANELGDLAAAYYEDRARTIGLGGQLPEALELLDEALSRGFRSSRLLALQGALRMASGDVDGAIASLEDAVSTEPSYLDAHVMLASAHMARGGREGLLEAEISLRAEIEIAPDRADLHLSLSNVLGALGDPSGAAKARAEALRLDPGLARR